MPALANRSDEGLGEATFGARIRRSTVRVRERAWKDRCAWERGNGGEQMPGRNLLRSVKGVESVENVIQAVLL
jgi:Fe-S oxidoreductase